jgi:hypothetical protein
MDENPTQSTIEVCTDTFRMRRNSGVDRERTAASVTSRGNFPQADIGTVSHEARFLRVARDKSGTGRVRFTGHQVSIFVRVVRARVAGEGRNPAADANPSGTTTDSTLAPKQRFYT